MHNKTSTIDKYNLKWNNKTFLCLNSLYYPNRIEKNLVDHVKLNTIIIYKDKLSYKNQNHQKYQYSNNNCNKYNIKS